MKQVLLIVAFILSFNLTAQPPTGFYVTFGGEGIDIGYSVKETYNRQYVIIGSTTSFGAGSADAYLLLVDSMGQNVWQKTFGGFSADVGKSIIVNPSDSGFVFAGFTSSFGNGGYDVYVVRTDKHGNLVWQSSFGGADWDFGNDLVFAADGHIIVCGNTGSSGHGKKDGYVLKVNVSNGALIWQKNYGGVEDDEFKSVYTKNGSEFYFAGSTKSFGEINGDMFLYKTDTSGDSLMRFTYGGNLFDGANDVTVINNNDIILVGGSESFSNGKMDAIFVKFSPSGNFKWRKNHGLSSENEEASSIVLSSTPSLEETVVIYSLKVPANGIDIQTVYLNYDGDYYGGFDSGKFGLLQDDEAYEVYPTKDKGYIEVGYTTSLNSINKDVFLIKMDSLMEEDHSLVGISKTDLAKKGVRIYPNPLGKEKLVIDLQDGFPLMKNVDVVIYDVFGREITFFSSDKSKIFIDSSGWESGVYLIKVKADQEIYSYKIVKQ